MTPEADGFSGGGTITVNGTTIIVPKHTLLQMPAFALTWQEVFKMAPAPYGPNQSGLAKADLPAPAYDLRGAHPGQPRRAERPGAVHRRPHVHGAAVDEQRRGLHQLHRLRRRASCASAARWTTRRRALASSSTTRWAGSRRSAATILASRSTRTTRPSGPRRATRCASRRTARPTAMTPVRRRTVRWPVANTSRPSPWMRRRTGSS